VVAVNFSRTDRINLDVNKDGVLNALDLVVIAANYNPIACAP
jgi:hypothetical protein